MSAFGARVLAQPGEEGEGGGAAADEAEGRGRGGEEDGAEVGDEGGGVGGRRAVEGGAVGAGPGGLGGEGKGVGAGKHGAAELFGKAQECGRGPADGAQGRVGEEEGLFGGQGADGGGEELAALEEPFARGEVEEGDGVGVVDGGKEVGEGEGGGKGGVGEEGADLDFFGGVVLAAGEDPEVGMGWDVAELDGAFGVVGDDAEVGGEGELVLGEGAEEMAVGALGEGEDAGVDGGKAGEVLGGGEEEGGES